jgi:hypothetical protein
MNIRIQGLLVAAASVLAAWPGAHEDENYQLLYPLLAKIRTPRPMQRIYNATADRFVLICFGKL